MADPGRSQPDLRAFSTELDDGLRSWTGGRERLRALSTNAEDAGVVLVLLSTGAEKLLKLTLGLLASDIDGSWPDKETMQRRWRHDIGGLDGEVQTLLWQRRDLSAARPYIEDVLSRAAHDEIRQAIFAALGAYARGGRFHNLDTLAGSPPEKDSPQALWEQVESRVLGERPDLLAQIANPAEYRQGREALNLILDQSLHVWQHALYRSWQHGLAGPQARQWSGLLHVDEPDPVRERWA